MDIPKIIHQIWYQGLSKAPKHLQQYHKSWIKMHPNYKFMVWDKQNIENLIHEMKLGHIYNKYDTMIQKIDIAKYVILLKYGGIYIDMDVKCLEGKSLDEVLNDDSEIIMSQLLTNASSKIIYLLAGHSMYDDVVNNAIIMTVPNHPILRQVLENIDENDSSILKNTYYSLYVFYSTGPLCFTKSINQYLRSTTDTKVKILDSSYFEPCDFYNAKRDCIPKDNTIGVHVYENSWVSKKQQKVLNICHVIINNFITFFLILLIVCFSCKIYWDMQSHRLV